MVCLFSATNRERMGLSFTSLMVTRPLQRRVQSLSGEPRRRTPSSIKRRPTMLGRRTVQVLIVFLLFAWNPYAFGEIHQASPFMYARWPTDRTLYSVCFLSDNETGW